MCACQLSGDEINANCDGHHHQEVFRVTAPARTTRHMNTMVNQWNTEAGMLLRSFARLTTATIVVAVVVLLAVPFFLALASPFIAR